MQLKARSFGPVLWDATLARFPVGKNFLTSVWDWVATDNPSLESQQQLGNLTC
jgi:hypothetical protein